MFESIAAAHADYRERTPNSQLLFAEAGGVIAGGVSRRTLAFEPYPFYAEGAEGAWLTDVDGNRYLDLVNNYTSLPHGHGHPPTLAAVEAELKSSPAIGAAHPLESAYAQELRERLPVLRRLHFTTTGSEAVAYAVRLARANTGRERVLKFEGAFHGSYGELHRDIASEPPLGPGEWRHSLPASAGLEATASITAGYNDPSSVRAAFDRWGGEIAAVVVEPFLGNSALVTAEPWFLDEVFACAARAGALVVFDEVQSLRADYAGAHGLWGYAPDLVAIGKIIGGGFPVAAYGGRADLFDALEGVDPAVVQTGTFTATPLALAAGRAAMSCLGRREYEELAARTERLQQGLREEFGRAGLDVQVNGVGSMFNVSFTTEPVTSYRAFRAADAERLALVRMELLRRGVVIMPRGTGCLSTAVSDADVDAVVDAVRASIAVERRS